MRKGSLVKYKVRGRTYLAIIRTMHSDGTMTIEARHQLIGGHAVGSYLGYRYRVHCGRKSRVTAHA